MVRKINFLLGIFFFIGISSFLRTIIIAWDSHLLDFSIFYYAGQSALQKLNPYIDQRLFTQASYPPFTFLFTMLFSLMPFAIASKIWTSLSVFSFLVGLYILSRITQISQNKARILFTLSVVSFPFKFTIGMGQINLILLFTLILSIYFISQKRRIASLFLSFAILMKLFPVVLLPAFILKHKYSYVKETVFITLFIVLISWTYFGSEIYTYYIKNILIPIIFVPAGSVYYNQSITGLFARASIPGIFLFVARVTLVIISFTNIIKKNFSLNSCLSIILTLVILINSFSWQHYFINNSFLFFVFN